MVAATRIASRKSARASLSRSSRRAQIEFTDSASDGTPDFLRLNNEADQQAFRRWFTFVAEVQYFTPVSHVPTEITNRAALVRYAHPEALRLHDPNWYASAAFAPDPGDRFNC
ncbi:MAG: DUF1175 family protein [Acidobacteriaceae bacterium]|nr:DUF1175 family protein [Acidobacteriaceae bacterium]MBV9500028.1 DUF1175 family protein [Acidobacteriaceae bacterium]